MTPGGLLRALVAAVALLAAALPSPAQEGFQALSDEPVLLTADEVVYDRTTDTVTAQGNVELSQDGRILIADRITYTVREGVVTASGNVSLLDNRGDVLFAEYMELDSRLATGFVSNVRGLLSDDSRLAATGARRFADGRTVMERAVYSPCEVCRDGGAPTWQIKAVKVIHDRDAQTISYRDATFEAFGIPIAYTPYFRHSDPTVKRKSGFLPPSFGSDSELGQRIQVPYYIALAPNRDATFAPISTSEEGVVLAGEYRELAPAGRYTLAGSVTHVDERDDMNQLTGDDAVRYHVVGDARFRLDENWQLGADVYRASDDTYLSRYDFDDRDTLTTDVFLHGERGRSRADIAAYAFQGLRPDDDSGTTPLVLPLADYAYVSEPWDDFGRFELTGNLAAITRSQSTDSRRLSLGAAWIRPSYGAWGQVVTLTASMRGDAFWFEDQPDPANPGGVENDGTIARVLPLGAVEVRYPLIADTGPIQTIIEPIVQGVVSPNGGNDEEIPNEDSLTLEFDDTNLFRLQRYPGYDRIETGPRINYGLRIAGYAPGGGFGSLLVGQVHRFTDDDTFAPQTGLDGNTSDYVTVLKLAPAEWLDLTNRMRIGRTDFDVRSHEVYLRAGPRRFRVDLTYVNLTREFTADQLEAREEVVAAARVGITRNIAVTAETRHDLTEDGGQLESGLGLEYADECVILLLEFERDLTRDRDVEPSTSFGFRIVLRNLG